MNTAKFLALSFGLAVIFPLAAESGAPNQVQPPKTCEEWFFNFPQSDQQGQTLEINERSLRNSKNLRPGYETWLQTVDTTDFRRFFFGKKASALVMYFDPCTGQPRIQFQPAEVEARVIEGRQETAVKPPSLGNSLLYTGSSVGATALLFAGPYGMIASPAVAFAPTIAKAIYRKIRGKPKPAREAVTSTVRYQQASADRIERPAKPEEKKAKCRPDDGQWHKFGECSSRSTSAAAFRMRGERWREY